MPLSSAIGQNALRNSGSLRVCVPCHSPVRMAGAEKMPNRSSMPDRNSAGTSSASMVPSWTPSTVRGIEPSWLAG